MSVKTLVFGPRGQLGSLLVDRMSGLRDAFETVSSNIRLDDAKDVEAFISSEKPHWIVNAAALTDVDEAHLEPNKAMSINSLGPATLALAASRVGARMIHISSEAVYAGARTEPYKENDPCIPVSTYGVSKLTGDLLTLNYSPDSFVLRTSWLYSGSRGTNFPTRIVAQLEKSDRPIPVVTDVVGNPTPASVLVDAIIAVQTDPPDPGLYHVSALGPASKFEWATEIARTYGHESSRIREVTSDEYTTIARRPKYVDLDCSKFLETGICALPHWRNAWLDTSVT